ncbi:MAG: L,D-transpeptidase family protein [Pseudomonadota bacterium]
MTIHRSLLKTLLAGACVVSLTLPGLAQSDAVAPTPFEQLLSQSAVMIGDVAISPEALADYYRVGGPRLWTSSAGVSDQAFELASELDALDRDGLSPADYTRYLPAGWQNATSADMLDTVEIGLSMALVKAARDLHGGRTTPSISAPDIVIARKNIDASALLADASVKGPKAALAALRPAHPQYAQLRQLLGGYRALAARGGWKPIDEGPTLKPGMQSERVLQLRDNLTARGYSGLMTADPSLFDEGLAQVIEHFQRRNGLDVDGAVGPATRGAMNISAQERVEQLTVNLERWRWLPRSLGQRHVLVNQAGFELFLVEDGKTTDNRRVIVGKPFHKSPMFSDAISYAEFNPTWTMPPSIAGRSYLPKLRANPGYFDDNGYKLYTSWKSDAPAMSSRTVNWDAVSEKRFPYRVVQSPGPRNALGQVKFMSPNEFAVYLHDTPSRDLFSRTSRTFSSGCIRVEKPLEFAQRLFGPDQGISQGRINDIVNSRQTKRISLKQKVPVHLTYFTTWVDDNGVPQFFEDVYKRDAPVAAILEGRA